MTATSRVDELRKRYHEAPKKFFAPFANELRKTGQFERALLILQKHLGEQAPTMNGLVVYGQCLFEVGRLDDARDPFEAALGIDPENLIALRHLGDIARLGGDAPKAREWYERLLEFDRRNEEVIALLAEVGGGEEKPVAASQAPNIVSVAGSVRVTTGTESLGMIDLDAPSPAPEASRVTPPRASAAVPTPSEPIVEVPPPRAVPLTPLRPLRSIDPSAKTVEVSAQAKPAKRASLLDVNFDFGEIGVEADAPAPKAPDALLPSEAAEYGFAAPETVTSAEDEIDALDALDAFVSELPSSSAPVAPRAEPADALPLATMFESSPEGESLSDLPEVDGIEKAEFSAEVSPLDGLESSEFESGAVPTLGDLEPAEFQPPDRPSQSIEGLESDEFQPLGLEETSGPGLDVTHDDPFGGDTPALSEDDAPARDSRASVAGLPLLEPFGTPTPLETPTVSDLPLLPSLEEAETIPIDLEAARRSMETPPTFVTETMAQVYVQQGHTDKAIEVYRQLIAQSPSDAGLRQRLLALEAPPAPEPMDIEAMLEIEPVSEPVVEAIVEPVLELVVEPPRVEPTVDTRSSLGFDTPLSMEPIDEPAPANAMLSATSFDGISLSTPATVARSSTPAVASVPVPPPAAPETGPSAREFFSRFAHRAATPSWTPSIEGAPTIGGQLMSPLDEIFGTNVPAEDEVAAHRLAGVGATSGPSGGSALDSLFGEGPSAPMPSSTPVRGSVTRASEKLRFDQFFASSTPVEGSLSTPTPAPPPPEPSAPADEPSDVGEDAAPGEDDDLDQFQGWLRGLTS